ncbi:hypothetical protein JTB14_010759 [Gonioctena quinquepunctata]|nr:hypothetical protein JTB14_010759 [Gonioctena quinquepunctata]
MFSNSFQSGFISIFYSVGSNPLSLWDKQVKNGHIRRVIDDEVKSLVLEISGTNVATTYINCPIKPRASLGIKLPFFVMIIKNMKKYFTFEIQILDDKDMHRRFRVSNFQSTTKVRPFCTTMPIGLSSGWNQVQFNLADFTKRAYGSTYLETMRVQVHANVRVRRLYFTDTLYNDEDMPNEFKLFGPMTQRAAGKKPEEKKTQPKEPPKAATEKPLEETPPPPSPAEISVDKKDSPVSSEETKPPTEIGELLIDDVLLDEEKPQEGVEEQIITDTGYIKPAAEDVVPEEGASEETAPGEETEEGVLVKEEEIESAEGTQQGDALEERAGSAETTVSVAASAIVSQKPSVIISEKRSVSIMEKPSAIFMAKPSVSIIDKPSASMVSAIEKPSPTGEPLAEENARMEDRTDEGDEAGGETESVIPSEPATTDEPSTSDAPSEYENELPEE